MASLDSIAPADNMPPDNVPSPSFFELYLSGQKAVWQNHYSAAIFSVFDHWLSEAEARAAFDPYFAQVAGKKARQTSALEIEQPYVAFFKALTRHGRLVRRCEDQQQSVSLEEVEAVALQAARETELPLLVELATQTHILPLHDLTLIVAVPIGQSLNPATQWAIDAGLHELWRSDP